MSVFLHDTIIELFEKNAVDAAGAARCVQSLLHKRPDIKQHMDAPYCSMCGGPCASVLHQQKTTAYDADQAAWRARVEALEQQFGSLEQLVHHVSKSLCDRVEALEKQLGYGDMLDRDVGP